MKHHINQKRVVTTFIILVLSSKTMGQNVGIGVTNPQKGKVEIAGALGGYSTVLTIGSDGNGISLQRNWPTIGFNQYRDASNTQRFIGAGHAGSIYFSSVDGSIVFSQFGLGTANQEITSATSPLYITGFGSTVVNGSITLKNLINAENNLVFVNSPKIVSNASGINTNLLPFAYGHIKSDGTKYRGTSNFTSSYNAGLSGYLVNFTENNFDDAQIVVTPRSQVACYATYHKLARELFYCSSGIRMA